MSLSWLVARGPVPRMPQPVGETSRVRHSSVVCDRPIASRNQQVGGTSRTRPPGPDAITINVMLEKRGCKPRLPKGARRDNNQRHVGEARLQTAPTEGIPTR